MKAIIRIFLDKVILIISIIADLTTFPHNTSFNKIKWVLLKTCRLSIKYPFFVDSGFRFLMPQNIFIGKNCSLGHYNKIWAFSKVYFGNNIQTAVGLTIVAGSHDTSSYQPLANKQEVILEGENWIGANVTILGGVTIGVGSIIGAGSVVNKSIPAYSIAAGVPAKVIKSRIPAESVETPFGFYRPKYYE